MPEPVSLPKEEYKELEALINKAKNLLEPEKRDSNLSFGTLDYLKRYKIQM